MSGLYDNNTNGARHADGSHQWGPRPVAPRVLTRLLDHVDCVTTTLAPELDSALPRQCGRWVLGRMAHEDLSLHHVASAAALPVATLQLLVLGLAEPDELHPSQRIQLAQLLCPPVQQAFAERVIAAAGGGAPLSELDYAQLHADLDAWGLDAPTPDALDDWDEWAMDDPGAGGSDDAGATPPAPTAPVQPAPEDRGPVGQRNPLLCAVCAAHPSA
ncbi:MAG: hypothetical protein HC911_17045 [Chloroflexaceae bacterium]|nr:hypothetical protein [Chloroflexaceae bacterium]